jgi:hypothetical protein
VGFVFDGEFALGVAIDNGLFQCQYLLFMNDVKITYILVIFESSFYDSQEPYRWLLKVASVPRLMQPIRIYVPL